MANRRAPEEEAEINLTPMLDVVFIMLIFFIVTATFVKEAGVTIEKPKVETAVKQKLASILIAVSADGEIWVDNRQIELGALTSVISKLYAENPLGTISIQADEKAPAFHIVNIADAAKEAGVKVISLSTDPL